LVERLPEGLWRHRVLARNLLHARRDGSYLRRHRAAHRADESRAYCAGTGTDVRCSPSRGETEFLRSRDPRVRAVPLKFTERAVASLAMPYAKASPLCP